MKHNGIILHLICIICLGITTFSCTQSSDNQLPEPKIKAGIATFSGHIVDYNPEQKPILKIMVPNPITFENTDEDIKVKEDRSFYIEIPIETSPALGYLIIDHHSDVHTIYLEPSKETKIEYSLYSSDIEKIKVIAGPNFCTENYSYAGNLLMKAVDASQGSAEYRFKYINKDSVNRFIATPTDYIPYALKYDLGERLKVLDNDTIISESSRTFLRNQLKLMYLSDFFHFPDVMSMLYNVINKNDSTAIEINEPDKSYYIFLKEFGLNNPLYLYNDSYSRIFQQILKNETLNLPKIGETSINSWLENVKAILSELTGLDKGLFYDILISSTYMEQLANKEEPLSDKQKQNITDYFKDAELAAIIFRKNDEVVKLTASKVKPVINETPPVSKELLLESIVSKYKDNVILVDLWATWCGPCLQAIKKMRPMKDNLKDKDIIFLYITNPSSPLNLWQEKINRMEGEHYYISEFEWEYITKKFNIDGIPTYLLYDKKGNLQQKFTGYPGGEKLQKKIEELL